MLFNTCSRCRCMVSNLLLHYWICPQSCKPGCSEVPKLIIKVFHPVQTRTSGNIPRDFQDNNIVNYSTSNIINGKEYHWTRFLYITTVLLHNSYIYHVINMYQTRETVSLFPNTAAGVSWKRWTTKFGLFGNVWNAVVAESYNLHHGTYFSLLPVLNLPWSIINVWRWHFSGTCKW